MSRAAKRPALDTDAHYTVSGWDGIAFYVYGFPKVWDQDEQTWESQGEECGRVLVVMVGDDRKHEVDVEDLTLLPETDYCAGCGQVGCGHDGRDH